MACHGILFCVFELGNVASASMSHEIALHLKHNETYKVIVYTNTKSLAEGHLLVLQCSDSGLMMKNWLVLLFSGAIQSSVSNLQVLLATTAANCGISSTYSLLAVCYGFLLMLIDFMQEIGHVCWGPQGLRNLQD